MQNRILIISLNAQNPIISNAKMSCCVTLLVGGSGIRVVLQNFSLISSCKNFRSNSYYHTMLTWKS
jgi:hypothetical protein